MPCHERAAQLLSSPCGYEFSHSFLGAGFDVSIKSLPTQDILRFYDSADSRWGRQAVVSNKRPRFTPRKKQDVFLGNEQ